MNKEQFTKKLNKRLNQLKKVIEKDYQNNRDSVVFTKSYDLTLLYKLIDSIFVSDSTRTPEKAQELEDLLQKVVVKTTYKLPYINESRTFFKDYHAFLEFNKEKNSLLSQLNIDLQKAHITTENGTHHVNVIEEDGGDILFTVKTDPEPSNHKIYLVIDEQYEFGYGETDLTEPSDVKYLIKALNIANNYVGKLERY